MLNISADILVEVPYSIGGRVVKVNGKPIILKVSCQSSSVFRNALVEAKRLYGDRPEGEEKTLNVVFVAAEILNGQENLMDDGVPVDCSDKENLRRILAENPSVVKVVIDASKKLPWTLEPLSSTPEN